jgi:hypothetical protein
VDSTLNDTAKLLDLPRLQAWAAEARIQQDEPQDRADFHCPKLANLILWTTVTATDACAIWLASQL